MMDHANYAINVTGGELPDAELAAYLERGKQKYGKQLLGLDVHLDGEYVELTYHLRCVPFDRVKHGMGGSDERLV